MRGNRTNMSIPLFACLEGEVSQSIPIQCIAAPEHQDCFLSSSLTLRKLGISIVCHALKLLTNALLRFTVLWVLECFSDSSFTPELLPRKTQFSRGWHISFLVQRQLNFTIYSAMMRLDFMNADEEAQAATTVFEDDSASYQSNTSAEKHPLLDTSDSNSAVPPAQ
jgi:hypothetical protein